ncbi:zinc-finger protein [Coccidioides immitis]|nr:zinc-finger protein [Coccidioides immitis]
MADGNLLSGPECFDISCWSGADFDNHNSLSCNLSAECCNMDDCADACTTVCDGFVDCDKSTICSESYCDNLNCEKTSTACYDKNCIEVHYDNVHQTHENNFLSQDGSLNWDCMTLGPEHGNCGFHGENFDGSFASHIHPSGTTVACDLSSIKDLSQSHFSDQQTPFDSHSHIVSGPCLNHGLGAICISNTTELCHNTGNCTYQRKIGGNLPLGSCSGISTPFASLHSSRTANHRHHHGHGSFQALALQLYHRRQEATPTITASTRSTPSLSMHSSPVPAPIGQEATGTPLFDASDFLGAEELHICRWVGNKLENKICGEIFPDAGSLQKHLTTAHADPTQGCQGQGYYCCWEGCSRPDEPFSQKSKLQGHFLTHSNYKSFRCSICGKPFARQATLERHERSHRGDKPYKCKECGKKFTDSSELKTHMRTHTGEKPFKCNHPGCTFETGDSSNMSSHKLTHGERKHKCPYPGCSKSFTRPDQLKRHLKGTHKHTNVFPSRLTSPIGNPSTPQI